MNSMLKCFFKSSARDPSPDTSHATTAESKSHQLEGIPPSRCVASIQKTLGPNYLSDTILKLLESVSTASGSVEICRAQCEILSKVFKQAGLFIQQFLSELGDEDNSNVIENLASSMEKGAQLINSCQEHWAIQALLHEESRAQFAQVAEDITESLRLLSLTLISLTDTSEKQRIEVSQGGFVIKDLESLLAAAAEKDRRMLLKKVESCSNTEASMKLLKRKATEARSGIRENLFIDMKQLAFKRKLSEGAYGAVHEVGWLDHAFAVKVFREGDTTFSRELAALVTLNHPNIVRVVGYSYDDETRRCALVMEKMSMDLAKFLKMIRQEKRNSLANSVSIMLEIACAMKLLHSGDIIHRDLKPPNILVDTRSGSSSFTIKVADLRFARTKFITNEITHATSQVGTRTFRAPEVYDSEKYSKKADVYSFAMVCYQILTGEMPFVHISSNKMLLDAVRSGKRPELPSICPVELEKLIKECWSSVPADRPDFWYIYDTLKIIKGSIVTRCSWDKVQKYEVASRSSGLHCFHGGGYTVQDLKLVVRSMGSGTSGTTHQASVCQTLVAVKCLKEPKANLLSRQQFQMLADLSHKNVLALRSYYCGERECLLVYDFVDGPSLAAAFHGGGSLMDWRARMKIVLGVAKGLAYLHSQASLTGNAEGFVHGALHFSNVLIQEGEGVLTDAGVSYVVRHGAELSQATDTHAFGVMVVELLTRKPLGLVRFLLCEKLNKEVFDMELHAEMSTVTKELVQMLRLAMACVSAAPPKMKRVAELIEKLGVILDDALPPGSALPRTFIDI